MAVQEALSEKLEELRRTEAERQKAKVKAFKEEYRADDVSLDRIQGLEVAILDKQYVILELHPSDGSGAVNPSGPGQGGYTPGKRWLIVVKKSSSGNPGLDAYQVKDLEGLAQLALLRGHEFEEMTGTLEAVLGLDRDVFWYNIQNR